jgi:NAD(P)-dependent dehydrogenase (short-subunit alcohol dehydrogenase family)
VAVVSGGGSGLGREVALELARRGYDLALLGRRREPLEETLALAGQRERGLILPCDVRDAVALERCAGEVQARWEAAALVVPAAGVTCIAAVEETSPDDFAAIVDTNLTGVFLLIRALLPAMRKRGRGWIIPLLSVAARRGFPGWGAYCASKWGLAGLVEVLREELRGSGVRISALYPGATDTPIWDRLSGEWNRGAMARWRAP